MFYTAVVYRHYVLFFTIAWWQLIIDQYFHYAALPRRTHIDILLLMGVFVILHHYKSALKQVVCLGAPIKIYEALFDTTSIYKRFDSPNEAECKPVNLVRKRCAQ